MRNNNLPKVQNEDKEYTFNNQFEVFFDSLNINNKNNTTRLSLNENNNGIKIKALNNFGIEIKEEDITNTGLLSFEVNDPLIPTKKSTVSIRVIKVNDKIFIDDTEILNNPTSYEASCPWIISSLSNRTQFIKSMIQSQAFKEISFTNKLFEEKYGNNYEKEIENQVIAAINSMLYKLDSQNTGSKEDSNNFVKTMLTITRTNIINKDLTFERGKNLSLFNFLLGLQQKNKTEIINNYMQYFKNLLLIDYNTFNAALVFEEYPTWIEISHNTHSKYPKFTINKNELSKRLNSTHEFIISFKEQLKSLGIKEDIMGSHIDQILDLLHKFNEIIDKLNGEYIILNEDLEYNGLQNHHDEMDVFVRGLNFLTYSTITNFANNVSNIKSEVEFNKPQKSTLLSFMSTIFYSKIQLVTDKIFSKGGLMRNFNFFSNDLHQTSNLKQVPFNIREIFKITMNEDTGKEESKNQSLEL